MQAKLIGPLRRDAGSSAVVTVDQVALDAYKVNRAFRQRAVALEIRLNSMTARIEALEALVAHLTQK
jgi:hypothetical protein